MLVALGVMSGCTSKDEESTKKPTAPVETTSPEEGTESEPWETAAAAAIDGSCTQCHDASRVFLTPYGNYGEVINRMEDAHGAVLSDEDKALITRFLDERTPDPAELVIKDKCTKCHDVGRIYAQPHDNWAEVVQRMTEVHGAVLAPEEQKLVVDYLTDGYLSYRP